MYVGVGVGLWFVSSDFSDTKTEYDDYYTTTLYLYFNYGYFLEVKS